MVISRLWNVLCPALNPVLKKRLRGAEPAGDGKTGNRVQPHNIPGTGIKAQVFNCKVEKGCESVKEKACCCGGIQNPEKHRRFSGQAVHDEI